MGLGFGAVVVVRCWYNIQSLLNIFGSWDGRLDEQNRVSLWERRFG